MTWAEVTINGVSEGKWDNAGQGGHAEIRIDRDLRAKYQPKDLRGKLISIVINRAPCGPCATALVKFKTDYGVEMRVKASRITRDGQAGLPIMSAAGIHFRLFTREQRDNVHNAPTPNTRTWNVKTSQAVTEKDRYEETTGGRDTKTLKQQDTAEAKEAAIAERYFPNARKGWKAQGRDRATLLGSGESSNSNSNSNTDSASDTSASSSSSPSRGGYSSKGHRYSPYGKTAFASFTPIVNVSSWREVDQRSWNAGDRFQVEGDDRLYRFIREHHGGLHAQAGVDFIIQLRGG